MSTEEQARELVAKERQHEEHVRASMLHRAEAKVHNSSNADNLTQEQARELAAQGHQHEEQLKESMLNRAKTEINASNAPADNTV
jgi:hypothetical protein